MILEFEIKLWHKESDSSKAQGQFSLGEVHQEELAWFQGTLR